MGKMELLILKHRNRYIRYTDREYKLCSMDKASVFPLSRLRDVVEHLTVLRAGGYPDASVGKLMIQEVPYDMDWGNEL